MSITVSLATTEEQSEASAFIFADSSEAEREIQIQEFLESINGSNSDQHQILIARESGTLVGAGVLVFTDTATAFFWPPFSQSNDCADAILQEMVRRIDRSGVSIGQSLLSPRQLQQRKLLTRNGFPHLTDLLFMRHPLTNLSQSRLPVQKPLEWVQYDEQQNHQRFLDLLDQTHQSSHDCPVLNDIRTAEESLVSHRSSGDSDQRYWYLFHRAGIDLGVLLLSEHQADNVWEVVYMGVAPEQRGHGYGTAFIQHGLQQAQAQHQSAVILAVDYKNSFAIKIYEDLGFVRQNTLSVHARLRSQFPEKKPNIN
ncbi:GNAT family N-acetyltransferase [Gimesia fumaroli]|uniref:Mycothiol acetyltransferase n=1 Tax=Gimesia fumaroli TaxID=2527976 RepID=A0A518I7I9_9PLAN|nr:GNAT family N-acetyltransferase [Gimesia fumaroli]QDV49065.1 Mycothiol acetyltransferase [Gimesia fumaroli]